MTSYTSKKLRFNNAEQFKESFSESDSPTVGYVFFGKHIPYANDASPDIISDTVATEKSIWDNMFAAKKITGNDIHLVVPRNEWIANTKYKQYDDTLTYDQLLTANVSSGIYPMYIMNSEGNVYKCLSNNNSGFSTVQPLGENIPNQGNILTADSYLWKYMFNVQSSNKFLSNTWMPVPISTSQLEYLGNDDVSVDGELVTIYVTDSGLGYKDNNSILVNTFPSSCSRLTLDSTIDIQNTVFVNMTVTGNGIVTGTYITAINPVSRLINLSFSTVNSGGGSGNLLSVITRVDVQGDGIGALASATIANTSIEKIMLTNYGSGYTYANVIIHGTTSGSNVANARAILAPKYGHAYNSAKELGAHNVMVISTIGEVDSTEGGLISTNTSFRQYGIIRDPHKYGQNVSISYANANSIIKQTTTLSLIAGSEYNENEFVYQGNVSNPIFSGYVNSQTPNEVYLTGIRGTGSPGTVLKGTTTNTTGRTVIEIDSPEFQPYTGDVLYGENILPVEREDGQSENIRFVVKF